MLIRKRPLRFSLIFLILLGALVTFSFKLIYIQFFRSSYLAGLAKKQHDHYVKLEPVRGTIYDRNMRPLALNIAVYSLYANPRIMTPADKARAMKELPPLLDISATDLQKQLAKNRYFVWIVRKLPIDLRDRIRRLRIRGLDFIKESRRFYPDQYLASQVIGFAGVDNRGLAGLELLYNRYLEGTPGWSVILRDARHRDLMIDKGFQPPKNGFNLVLTIDETIQYIAERALEEGLVKNHAKSGTVIVMNPHTGEILALANRPTYNLQKFSESKPEDRIDRAVALVFEPGSAFKVVTASAALDAHVISENDKIFCENGHYDVGGHILHDDEPHGFLTFRQVIEYSSNIGTTKVAQKMGAQTFYQYASRFGFGKKTGVDLVGEVPGDLKPPSQWSKTTIGAMPIGQEVTVTPIQLADAISTVANGGVAMKPFVVKYIEDDKGQVIRDYEPHIVDRVISESTDRRMKSILEGVVEHGTGERARITGLTVAGKTGTAQKVVNGRYSHTKFQATFYGFAPVDDPRIAVVVTYDEPHPSYYGGTVAAPVFREVVVNTLKYLDATESKGVSSHASQ